MCACSVSFAWTGYYLEKKLGSLRFLLVLSYLLLLSQLLLASAAFVVAKTLLVNVSGSRALWGIVCLSRLTACVHAGVALPVVRGLLWRPVGAKGTSR